MTYEQESQSDATPTFGRAEQYKQLLEGNEAVNVVNVPELVIEPHAPRLSERQSQILADQWSRFWELRSDIQSTNIEPSTDVKAGSLLHQMRYNPDVVKQILGSGIMAGELGFGDKAVSVEDSETHYCADFFVNREDRTVREYLDYARDTEPNIGNVQRSRIERYALPDERGYNIAFVVNPEQSELHNLLDNSATGETMPGSQLADFPIRFPYSEGDQATRHKAVLVGVPANYITEMIVSGGIRDNPETIAEIKNAIETAGLNTRIVDSEGMVL